MKKLHIGVIYGGRSGEHEVSIASAAAVIKSLDRDRYEPVPIRIDKDGRWTIQDRPPTSSSAAEVIEHGRVHAARSLRPVREAYLVPRPGEERILTIERGRDDDLSTKERQNAYVTALGLDVVFPVLHGPYGEDGTVQGLLELANVPYVGAGVLASAVGMDKVIMKRLFAERGLPIVAFIEVLRRQWNADQHRTIDAVGATLGYPVFVKPANLGSSVGISKVKAASDLGHAIDHAAEFDRKVIIEAAVPSAREIECAVLGNDEPDVSVPGEIIPSREFYDYEAKYIDEGSQSLIPAALTDTQTTEVRRLAIEAFKAIDAAGMARVDFLLSADTGALYVNEINTIPGFTTISMFSKLWAASGLEYPALLDRLVRLALDRHAEKQQVRTTTT
ncbi:MAG: D-alanine--D-alanine ligase [Acidobacteria bacterium]|nr:MAG: D-alanine--D-alanine ligase [Acidobacteriota bacterium]